MSKPNLKRLLRPKTLAVVGGRFAEAVIRQSDLIGFKGEIFPISSTRESMQGRRCYTSASDLPTAPDACFVAVDREQSIRVIADLAKLGAGGVVAYAAGFAEVGDEGARLQEELVSAKADMALVGPNCYGMLNYLDGVALWPDEHGGGPVKKGAAIVLQSGNIGVNLTMQQRGLPLAYLISVGNQADVQMHDYVEAFLEDERITCIGLHIEGLTDIAAFSKVALKALERKVPIVVLKTGVSEAGQTLTLSHTSSLAGSDVLYSALFERYGISRVHSLSEFLETLKFLSVLGPLPSKRIASISCSGGEAALLADLASGEGLELPQLIPSQKAALFEVLGEKVSLSNPLDYHTYIWNDESAQQTCFAAMVLGEQDITLKILDYPRPDLCDVSSWDKTARAFINALKQTGKKGVIVSTLPETLPEQTRDWLVSKGVAPMQGLEHCLKAVRHAHAWGRALDSLAKLEPLKPFRTLKGAVVTLNEQESKALLTQFGLASPRSLKVEGARLERSRTDCDALGYPLAVKVLAADIVHKTDVGGVVLNVQSFAELKQVVSGMQHLSREFLLEEMLEPPITELLLGISRDAQFGLSITVAAGGIWVELLKDSQTLLVPTHPEAIESALKSLKIFPLLKGFRSKVEVALEPIIAAVLSLAKLAETCSDSLLELDINPLFVYPDRVVAADAVIRIGS